MKSNMFFRLTGVLFFTLLVNCLPAQVKIGDNPSVQDPSAVLELEKTNMGLLIPRVALIDAQDDETIPTPANSLLVYNTNNGGEGNDSVSPGFYYWDDIAGRWKGLLASAGPGSGYVWIDPNNNILSSNSANQDLRGTGNIVLGEQAFEDWNDTTNSYIAIGYKAGKEDETDGDADVVAIGFQSAFSNSGTNVNAIGWTAGYDNSGEYVNAFGREAANFNQGNNLNAFGLNAANKNLAEHVNAFGFYTAYENSGFHLNAFGHEAGFLNEGDEVNALGAYAARDNKGWAVNAFGGAAAMRNNGYIVNAIGPQSCDSNWGNSVNGMGHLAAQRNLGSEVNAMGAMSAQFNTEGNVNAFGNKAAQYNTGYNVNALGPETAQYNSGDRTNAMGYGAAKYNSGADAVAIGEMALYGGDTIVKEGGGNIGIGYHAGINIGTGSNNIAIGYDTPFIDGDAAGQINIGGSIIRDEFGVIQLKDLIQLTPRNEEPSNPQPGMIYYDGTSDKIKYYTTGSEWKTIAIE